MQQLAHASGGVDDSQLLALPVFLRGDEAYGQYCRVLDQIVVCNGLTDAMLLGEE